MGTALDRVRSQSTSITAMQTTVREVNDRIDVNVGQPMKDVAIDAPSREFFFASLHQDYTRRLQSPDLIEEVLDDDEYIDNLSILFELSVDETKDRISGDINNMAANEGLTRIEAVSATGAAVFSSTTAGLVSVPRFSTINTGGEEPIEFQTTTEVVDGTLVFDAATQLFSIEIPIEAKVAGQGGIVIANTITSISPSLNKVTLVTNPLPTSGGRDQETDKELLERIRISKQGRNINTLEGYRLFVLNEGLLTDALVVGPPNPLMIRAIINAVDIYIQGRDVQAETDIVVFASTEIVLQRQPVVDISSVVGDLAAVQTVYVKDVDFRFVKDDQGFAGSIQGQDKIIFDVSGGKVPSVNETLTIQYTVDQRVKTFQELMDKPENRVPGISLLIKEATEVLIDIGVIVIPFAAFTQTETETAVQSALTSFFAAFNLSQNVNRSDVVAEIEGVSQVDRIEGVPTGTPGETSLFSVFDRSGGTGNDDIVITDREFARLGSIDFGTPSV